MCANYTTFHRSILSLLRFCAGIFAGRSDWSGTIDTKHSGFAQVSARLQSITAEQNLAIIDTISVLIELLWARKHPPRLDQLRQLIWLLTTSQKQKSSAIGCPQISTYVVSEVIPNDRFKLQPLLLSLLLEVTMSQPSVHLPRPRGHDTAPQPTPTTYTVSGNS